MSTAAIESTAAATSPFSSRNRIPELDGLRGLAIVLVLIWHYMGDGAWSFRPGTFFSYLFVGLRLTWSGVDLFFVLSGFLIGGILLDARSSPRYFKTFYVRRIFRIVPLYGLLVASFYAARAAGIAARCPPILFDGPMPWYSYLTFTQNFWMAHRASFGAAWFSVTWSLAIEEQFYLTLPAVIRKVSLRALPYVLGGAIAAAPLLRLYLYFHYGPGPLVDYFLMPCRADALLLGVFAAFLLRRPSTWETLQRRRSQLIPILAGFLVGLIFFTLKAPRVNSFWMVTIGFTWLAFTYLVLLLLALVHADGWFGRLFRIRWLTALGTISYGVYLLHVIVLALCSGMMRLLPSRSVTLTDVATSFLALALTLVVAQISWRYFERPLLRIGHRAKY